MNRTAMLGLLAVLSTAAAEAGQEAPGWRIGGQASFTDFDWTDGDQDLIKDGSVGGKLFAQYQFNNWFALEGGWQNTGDFKESVVNAPDGAVYPVGDYKLGFDGFSGNAVVYLPVGSEEIRPFLKAGLYDFDTELSYEGNVTSSGSESGLTLGGGVAIQISDRFGLRADAEWFDAEVGDLVAVNIGLLYAFGGDDSEPAAAPVAAAPVAAPEPAPPPPPPPPAPPADSDGDGVTDDADKCPGTPAGAKVDATGCEEQIVLQGVTFETNSAQLTSESVAILDNAANLLKQRANFKVQVSGHTDSSGPDEYNLDLSQRRAAAVMDYLVSAGVDDGQLSSAGYGEAQPVADNSTAEGRAANRRVTLDFTGAN
jgi:outer membrane protein OmpA-like peptidoglycan-associated protein